MNVQEVMTSKVWTCRPDEPLSVAARIMWDHDVGAVPVVSAEGKLVGIITDRDVCMSAYFTGKVLESVPVEHAMSKQVFSATTGQSVESAEQMMRSKEIRRLPVVDGEAKLVGIVSLADLARVATGPRKRSLDPLSVTATLADVVKPRQQASVAA